MGNNMKTGQLFINGVWINAQDSYEKLSPSTNHVYGVVGKASKNDVKLAVDAASNALPMWSNYTVAKRASIVKKAADILIEMYGDEGKPTDLKSLITDEMGKRFQEADIEVIESSDMAAYFSENGERLLSHKDLTLNTELWPTKKSIVEHEPVGVVGVIKTWNYPLKLPILSIAHALIAGNTVDFKPSEHSPFVGLEIGKIFERAGLPNGVLNIITGCGKTGEHLVEHENVDMIDFTGSVETGKKIAVSCAASLKKYNLELGGNDAAIVCDDADLELTSNGLVWGAFCNSGQVCVGVKRVFIAKSIKGGILQKILSKTNSLVPDKDYGPIISESQLQKIENFVCDAITKGAKVLSGGTRIKDKSGLYYLPTVLTGLTSDMRIMQEECFGPLLPIIFVNDTDEAIILANDSIYGLGASIWTSDKHNGIQLARKVKSGMVWINDVNVAFPEAPWGGIKSSGIGIALSDQAIYEYTEYKHISIEESDEQRRIWWYPYS